MPPSAEVGMSGRRAKRSLDAGSSDQCLRGCVGVLKRPRLSSESAQEAYNDRAASSRVDVFIRPGIPVPATASSLFVPDKPSPPFRDDDKDGHYVFELGDNLSSRFKILSKLGEGTFGRVVECWDRKFKEYVAIKIVRNVEKYRHAAMIELEVLNTLEKNDPICERHWVCLREWFDYRGHVCMVFEKLGPSLYDLLRKNDYRPFPLGLVQDFGRQLLENVSFLHDLTLVHTDLKPENILLISEEPGLDDANNLRVSVSSRIKVIDFGSATFEDQYHSTIVSTRHYRAPEVILGCGWSYPCDMWSIGCILIELVTGDALFQTHDNLEHLVMMERVLGPFPEELASKAGKAATKYFVDKRLNWPQGAVNKKSVRSVNKMLALQAIVEKHMPSGAREHTGVLLDLLQKVLAYDPACRLTAKEALQHPFFHLDLS